MSRKSLLNIYLSKAAAGDEAAIQKLLGHLSNRLVFVTLMESSDSQDSGSVKLSIACINEGDIRLTPVFTSDQEAAKWAEKNGGGKGSESLLGADLCAALGGNMWIVVNPGSEDSVRLTPAQIQQMARLHIEEPAVPATAFSEASNDNKLAVEPTRQHQESVAISGTREEPTQAEDLPPAGLASGAVFSASTVKKAEKQAEPQKKRSFLDFLKLS